MKRSRLLLRNLIYYWRTNLPIVGGVAIAVAVLTGALLVGQSVRASLRNLLFERIGAAEYVITAEHFFGEKIAAAMSEEAQSCPVIYLKGALIREQTGVQSHRVRVYGVDERFWKFHGLNIEDFADDRTAYVGDPLARQLGIQQKDGLLLRIEIPQAIPREWLYGRRDYGGRTIRLNCGRILSRAELGEFALQPSQGNVHSVFVPLKRLQKDLAQKERINALLMARPETPASPESILRLLAQRCTLQDLGLGFRTVGSGNVFSLESDRIILGNSTEQAALQTAASMGLKASPVYTYLANAIRAGNREIPYSVITAADLGAAAFQNIGEAGQTPASGNGSLEPIWLTQWAQRDLAVSPGMPVEIDYYLWQQDGRLETRTARFRLAGILPDSPEIDATLAPQIPGVTDATSISSWDPPFPLDMERIRPADEDYWHRFKATPKAFISLASGQRLWQSRFGKLTALRVAAYEANHIQSLQSQFGRGLLSRLNPQSAGFAAAAVRESGLTASRGSTDFGEYFVYFSFFLIAAALMLAALFFRLMIEQRVREIGLLQACGFSTAYLRRNFLYEGALLSLLGSILGLAGSLGYGWLMVFGLRTWWKNAVGTARIFLYVSWPELSIGCLAGIVFSLASLVWTLRALGRNSIRTSLSGVLESHATRKSRVRALAVVSVCAFFACAFLLLASLWGVLSPLQGFFGSGFLLLLAILCATALYLRRSRPVPIGGRGLPAFVGMGFRNATHRPGRSLFCACLIAAATFIIVSTEAFRRNGEGVSSDFGSGTGGFALLAESTLPILYDLNSLDGREAIGLSPEQTEAFLRTRFVPFRERPGDDVSCLNLYAPQEPAILGAQKAFYTTGRFSFQDSLASTPEQKKNPWLLLDSSGTEPFVPAIADANTLQYILRLSLGSDLVIRAGTGGELRLRFVAALEDSILQGKLIISESNFLRAFPDQEGYRFFLLDVPQASAAATASQLQEGLADYGFAVEATGERLASYHRVENTYISTFQSLGTLGLFLGTLGLATVLLRNVLERRQELALLRAVGFQGLVVSIIVLSENMFLVLWGLISGVFCAFVAILPAILARGVAIPFARIGFIMFAVFAAGLLSSIVAVIAAHRAPLLKALRSE